MPAHQYVVFDHRDPPVAATVLLAAIRDHLDAYDAYFRGYQRPMRYLELPDGLRYWRTVLNGTHMLNRCTLDSVEPPRRVDQDAKQIAWQGPPWALFGSPWPPGYVEIAPGRFRYDRDQDWCQNHRCTQCGVRFFLSAPERPCPHCGAQQHATTCKR